MINTLISVFSLFRLVYEAYKIIPHSEPIPSNLYTVDGIEMLVETNKLPREVATIMYKAMLIARDEEIREKE
jgi:hypothetical protein